jgi:hypothetical protein
MVRPVVVAPRCFVLRRRSDPSGISGVGDIAWGCEFPDGVVVLRWRTFGGSTAVYDSLEALVTIHGHDGSTQVVWL